MSETLLGPPPARGDSRPISPTQSLTDVLDRVLNKGIVVTGELVIRVAEIDLLYIGLQAVVTSIETMRQAPAATPLNHAGPELEVIR